MNSICDVNLSLLRSLPRGTSDSGVRKSAKESANESANGKELLSNYQMNQIRHGSLLGLFGLLFELCCMSIFAFLSLDSEAIATIVACNTIFVANQVVTH